MRLLAALPSPTPPEGMGELDRRAIDTVRVLAMDAVQRVGNGHPGTAMSLAPTAYLLFQKGLRHDPSDSNWGGRDRFVLSMGHSSLTLYIRLSLFGYGLELSDLEALRTWRSRTPRHPEVNHTPRCGNDDRPAGSGSRPRTAPTASRCCRRPCAPGSASRPACPWGWREPVGDAGRIVGINHFGASAAYTVLYDQFGLTADAVVAAARESLAAAEVPPAAPTGPDGAGVLHAATGDR